jgi:hypothetical protein
MKQTYMQFTFEQGRPECERTMLHCQFTTADDGHAKVLLVLADQDMLHRSAELGHGQPVFMDTTFSIVRYKMSFLTLIALDEEGRGEPVLWAFLPDEQQCTFERVLHIWRDAVLNFRAEFRPSCFLTDDCNAEQNAIECAPEVKAWHAFVIED